MSNLSELINKRISRRAFLSGLLVTTSAIAFGPDIKRKIKEFRNPDYDVIISWGDSLADDTPFDHNSFTLADQLRTFGYNNDYIAYRELGKDNGLLCINHESAYYPTMFRRSDLEREEQVKIEQAAHGASVIEVKKNHGKWEFVRGSKYNYRINAYDTEMELTGPVGGKSVIGMLGNCAGGKTPWGTVLTCEENFGGYFTGKLEKHLRYDCGTGDWGNYDSRFDLTKNPDEAYKFGWVVEYDPYDPSWKPKKRTALGRMAHEGANTALTKDNRVVVYMGDDKAFEYLYKFITRKKFNADNLKSNRNLLDDGTLYVAKFHESGKLEWLPIPQEELLHTREAADKLGATTMDRPEDVEVNPVTGKVYVTLTNNYWRTETNPANPRPKNIHGHIIEITEDDHADLECEWDIYILGTDSFSCPDNLAFDDKGNMYVTTDTQNFGGLHIIKGREAHQIFLVEAGAEMTGPEFAPDYESIFLSAQGPNKKWPNGAKIPRPSVINFDYRQKI